MFRGNFPPKKDEVKVYIEHHLKTAGAKHTIFSDNVMEAIVSRSKDQGQSLLLWPLAKSKGLDIGHVQD